MNERFNNAINKIPQNTPPIWCMRQAGRYHSHYQKLRAKFSFVDLCKIPTVAAQVALGPVEDFDFDVAILFSDLLFPLEALGFGLTYGEKGPVLDKALSSAVLSSLKNPADAVKDLIFQQHALIETKKILPKDKSLIGFVGGHATLYNYACGTKTERLLEAKKNLTLAPKFLEILTEFLIYNIELQLNGGAEVVMMFDSSAAWYSPRLYKELFLPHLKTIAKKFPKKIGYYMRGGTETHLNDPIFYNDFVGLGVDHRYDLNQYLKLEPRGFVQGNFDETLLHCVPEELKKHIDNFANTVKYLSPDERKGWICGLGHGVTPETPEGNMRIFVERIRELFS